MLTDQELAEIKAQYLERYNHDLPRAADFVIEDLYNEVERLRYLIWMEDSWATKAVYADDDPRGDRQTTCRVCNETIRIRNWHEHLNAHPEKQRWDKR